MVLRYPPSVVAGQVLDTLSAAAELLEMTRAAVSIWPIFIASVEAYTSEAQALAECVLSLSTSIQGATNRAVIHQVVREVWRERKQTAERNQCEVSKTFVDWRKILKELDVEILLL